ncbi:MAG: glucose-6-phosphate isomerase [Pyramidobacter sp.]|jgi:glucose-6-phosphate isomerase
MFHVKLMRSQKAADATVLSKAEAAWKKLLAGAEAGAEGFGWMNLPERDDSDFSAMAEKLLAFSSVVLIGIGGSSLGLQMLVKAFLHPAYPFAEKGKRPRLFVADNVDGRTNEAIWEQLVPQKTALLVVSKSGRTLETLSNFIFFREKLYGALGTEAEKHIFAVTSPTKGFLRRYAEVKGTFTCDFPEDTGGRYSVLSSCGLAAAATLGIDARELRAGAADMKKALLSNPMGSAATALASDLVAHCAEGKTTTVFWTYGDRLASVGQWFAQLWGESLGKDGKGMTPQAAQGSIDQHSQLQLYACGPADKYFIFLSVKPDGKAALNVPKESLFDEARYLEGMTPEKVLECERRGVAASLKRRGLPTCEIVLDDVAERTLGGVIFFLETVTALTGFMLGIDPFDQPGVEEGKNYALALCGAAAYAQYLEKLREIDAQAAAEFRL